MEVNKMTCKVLRIFICLICVKPETDSVVTMRKFNHQKDMSEYCRRRVAPSVFLGKQVMEANSHIMHFSQLEVPYSCMISVRTESGNDIILVIQLLSKISLIEACSQSSDQLIVYELGETFGGYWGHLPDTLIKERTKNYTQFYTLKTTKTMTTERTKLYTTDNPNKLTQTYPVTNRAKDFIRMEIPLVNVSGNFQLGPPLQTYNVEEMFDFIYDVTPRNGVEYETSILPLVQFSIRPRKLDQKSYDAERRYDLDYAVNRFTLDSRLLFKTAHKRLSTKRRMWRSSRKGHFYRKNTTLFVKKERPLNFPRLFSTGMSFLVTNYTTPNTAGSIRGSTSWEIEDIIKSLSTYTLKSTLVENVSIQNILNKISNIHHNVSIYLSPNLSIFEKNNYYSGRDDSKTVTNLPKTSAYPLMLSSRVNGNHKISDGFIKKEESTLSIVTRRMTVQNNREKTDGMITDIKFTLKSENTTEKSNETYERYPVNLNKEKNRNNTSIDLLQRGNMVDHESWENVVQAAPVMAVVLNKNEKLNNNSKEEAIGQTFFNKSEQRKRHVQALDIESSRPRNLTTQDSETTEIESEYQLTDIQDLASLVELQDDEIEGRSALRYLRNYVGSVLFNICDFQEAKTRQVFLFNASRIVIAINNFTLEGMTLVLTPAQALLRSESLCEPGYLECQIIGSRVCIDSMNSCDGVPNCGSYDIYDEDRLKCGVSKGLQHNVYLAAFTFLAVILTLMYTVHYWLKRCVPKVSDAFFIYTDASEKTFYLDSIMRSPKDVDDLSYKVTYPGHFFDNDLVSEEGYKEHDTNENLCKRIMKKFIFLCFRKKQEERNSDYASAVISAAPTQRSKISSFTEFELRKFALTMSTNEAVQTGDSIEIQIEKQTKEKQSDLREIQDSLVKLKLTRLKDQKDQDMYKEELKIIKFAKETGSASQCDTISEEQKNLGKKQRRDAFSALNEKEIKSTVYEQEFNSNILSRKIQVKCEIHPEKQKKHIDAAKRLRFDEELTMIPSLRSLDENSVNARGSRRSVFLGLERQSNQDLDIITPIEGPENSNSRDFFRFWIPSKGKRSKGESKKKKEKHIATRFK